MQKKHIALIIIAVIGLAGTMALFITFAAAGIFFTARSQASKEFKKVASVQVMKPPPPSESFNFNEDFRVHSADVETRHFIKVKLSLGFEPGNAKLSAELARRKPQLRAIINLILAGKTKEQLGTVSQRLELREEMKASINHVLKSGKIEEVYFREFIVN